MRPQDNETFDDETVVQEGCGNVFADLGLPNSEDRLAKARLVERIAAIIEERRLTQKQAGELLGIDQAKVSKLVRGRLREFSTSTLIGYLTLLDQDVEIVVRPKKEERATLHVTF